MFYGFANKDMFAAVIIAGVIYSWYQTVYNMLMNNKLVNRIK